MMAEPLLILYVLKHGLYGFVLLTLQFIFVPKLINRNLILTLIRHFLELFLKELFSQFIVLLNLLFDLSSVAVVEDGEHEV